MNIRFATETDLPRVNELRRQVSELHAEGLPDIFRPGFAPELADFINVFFQEEDRHILVAERDGRVVGFACLTEVDIPASKYKMARHYLEVDEFGVDANEHRQGIGRKLFEGIRELARSRGFQRIELNMWEFNESALKFYEAIGFSTYRRHMEYTLD